MDKEWNKFYKYISDTLNFQIVDCNKIIKTKKERYIKGGEQYKSV